MQLQEHKTMGDPLRSLPTEDNRTSRGRYSPSWAKRFSREKALRPIVCEILLQLLPWRFCNFTRERSSSSENLTENPTVRAFCSWRKAYSSLECRLQNSADHNSTHRLFSVLHFLTLTTLPLSSYSELQRHYSVNSDRSTAGEKNR